MISKPVTVAVMNCLSIKNKKVAFSVLVDEHKLNIIIGSESWISPAVHSIELFPANYIVYRKDQEDGYEGYSFRAVRGYLVRIYHLLQRNIL